MSFTDFPNGVTSFGMPVMGGGGIPAMFGNVYFVDYRNGLDGNDGKTKTLPLKTLSAAYAKCTSNNNDVILIDGDSEIQEDSKITWVKNRIHVVGLGSGMFHAQRARIATTATGTAAAVDSTIEVSGTGNSFENLKFVNTGTDAASLACLIDSGEANTYINCSFMKLSDLSDAAVSDAVLRGDSSTFIACEFGADTVLQAAARATVRFLNSGTTKCKHLLMRDCQFTCSSSNSDKAFMLVGHTSALQFSNLVVNPIFTCALVGSTSAATLDNAIDSVSGLLEGNLLVVNPSTNTTAVCATVTDQIQVVGPLTHVDAGAPQTPA